MPDSSDAKQLVVRYPFVSCFPHHANYLSILTGYEACHPWIFNHFVQLQAQDYFDNDGPFIDFCFFRHQVNIVPWLKNDIILLQHTDAWRESGIVELLIRAIDRDFYANLLLDDYYIAAHPFYRVFRPPIQGWTEAQKHSYHFYLIWGYDRSRQVFHAAGNLQNFKYRFATLTFQEVSDAFDTPYGKEIYKENHLQLYRMDTSVRFDMELGALRQVMVDYVESRDTSERYGAWAPARRPNIAYGLAVYDRLADYMRKLACGEPGYVSDVRPWFAIKDHKQLMARRAEYLHARGVLEKSLVEQAHALERSAAVLANLFLKSHIARDYSGGGRIVRMVREMGERERNMAERMIDRLNG